MKTETPITIGVTGHRKLPKDKILTVSQEVTDFFIKKINLHAKSNITVLSSLAEGVDMLCAKLAIDMGLRLIVPLPINKLEYLKDFSEETTADFNFISSKADDIFIVTPEEIIPDSLSRGFYYRQAGIYVAKHCDVLLAVWDGVENDTKDGAGTWETVKIARKFEKEIYHLTI